MTTFRSLNSKLSVSLDPDKFGTLIVEGQFERTAEGRALVDDRGRPLPRRILKPILQFNDGHFNTEDPRLEVQDALRRYKGNTMGTDGKPLDPEDAIIQDLRKHSGNKDNGGALFWEVPDADENVIFSHAGIITITMPKAGLSDADREILATLVKKGGNSPLNSDPAEIVKTRDQVRAVLDRFKVKGVSVPPNDKKIPMLKAAIINLMDAFEEKGIWPEQQEVPKEPKEVA